MFNLLPKISIFDSKKQQVKKGESLIDNERLSLQAAINSINLGFVITNDKGEIININRAAKKILCFADRSPKLKSSITEPLLAKFECTIEEINQQLIGVLDLKTEIDKCLREKKAILLNSLDHKNLIIRIMINPIVNLKDKDSLDLDIIGTVILIEDITEDVILERSKRELFSIATHELKTPLTVIKGNLEVIRKYFPHLLEDSRISLMFDDVYENSVRLMNIVNDFLDASRLEQGRINFKKEIFDLSKLILETVEEFKNIAEEKNLSLNFESETGTIEVFSDPVLARQVLINLVDNALKFTHFGEVKINTKIEEGVIKVLISDTGEGISPNNKERLFKKFQFAHDNLYTRSTNKSTGLGLYISKLMAEGMGGELKLENSELGKGSEFCFTLPLVRKEAFYTTFSK